MRDGNKLSRSVQRERERDTESQRTIESSWARDIESQTERDIIERENGKGVTTQYLLAACVSVVWVTLA
jgi:hypothetical protein